MSNYQPGSAFSEIESIVSSENEMSISKESNFSNPVDELGFIDKNMEIKRDSSKFNVDKPKRREESGSSESISELIEQN